jgi:nucleoid-associated protein YgaU
MRITGLVLVLVVGLAAVGCQKKTQREQLPQLDTADLQAEQPPVKSATVVDEGRGPPRPAASYASPPIVSTPAPGMESMPPAMGGQTYTVQKGDTLYSIARRYYGDGKLWTRIDEANRGKYKSPNAIPVGTILVIPPK